MNTIHSMSTHCINARCKGPPLFISNCISAATTVYDEGRPAACLLLLIASSLPTNPCWSPRDTHGILGMMKPWQMGALPLRAHLPYLCHRLVQAKRHYLAKWLLLPRCAARSLLLRDGDEEEEESEGKHGEVEKRRSVSSACGSGNQLECSPWPARR